MTSNVLRLKHLLLIGLITLSFSATAEDITNEQKKAQLEKKLTDLNQQVLAQQQKLKVLLKENKTNQNTVDKTTITSQKLVKQLKDQQQKFRAQAQQIQSREEQVNLLTEKIKRQQEHAKQVKTEQQLNKQKQKKVNNDELIQQAHQIVTLNDQLGQQKTLLKDQTILQVKKQTIPPEKTEVFGSIFYLTLVIAIIALAIAGMLFMRHKKALSSLSQASATLTKREQQLVRSEQVAALAYIASDITYAAGTTLDDIYHQSAKNKELINKNLLKPTMILLENFNQISADQDEEESKTFEIVSYIDKIIMLFSVEFKHSNIKYNYSGENALQIRSIPSQIALLIVNLVNNSLKHGFVDDSSGKICINITKTDENKTKIIFQDNGLGMNTNILEQAFLPFFTTKDDKNYVGIGLSTSYDIVKNKLSGDIKITSQPDEGTEVAIIL